MRLVTCLALIIAMGPRVARSQLQVSPFLGVYLPTSNAYTLSTYAYSCGTDPNVVIACSYKQTVAPAIGAHMTTRAAHRLAFDMSLTYSSSKLVGTISESQNEFASSSIIALTAAVRVRLDEVRGGATTLNGLGGAALIRNGAMGFVSPGLFGGLALNVRPLRMRFALEDYIYKFQASGGHLQSDFMITVGPWISFYK